jgi:hypothetical protein
MALRLRRGTDAERAAITPKDGEMIWTTDTNELYVGDGTTTGGIRITGALNDSPSVLTRDLSLAGFDIIGSGDILMSSGDITVSSGTITATNFIGDGSQLTNISAANLDVADLVVEGGNYKLSVVADDSTILVDYTTGNADLAVVTADSITASTMIAGAFVGDLTGSIFADDSSLVVDGLTGDIYTNNIIPDQNFSVDARNSSNEQALFNLYSGNPTNVNDASTIILWREDLDADLSTDGSMVYGKLQFGRNDTNGARIASQFVADPNRLWWGQSTDAGAFPPANIFAVTEDGYFGVGTYSPTVGFDIQKDTVFAKTLKLASATGGAAHTSSPEAGQLFYNSTSNRLNYYNGSAWAFPLAAEDGDVYLANTLPIQQANYSTTQRNIGLGAAEVTGVTFYNTTEGNLQVYNGTDWKNIPQEGGTFVGDVNGSINMDDSTTIINGVTGDITAPGTVTFNSYTTTEKNALSAVAGMTVYDSTLNRLSYYNGTGWVDLA